MGFFHQVFYKVLKDMKKCKSNKCKQQIDIDKRKHKIKIIGGGVLEQEGIVTNEQSGINEKISKNHKK